MRRRPPKSGHNHEQGIIVTLAAVFMLFVVGAMAALSIDVVTFYTARSEAQIAADSAALAAARVLANSGMTSSTGTTSNPNPFPVAATETLARNIATQIAQQNPVGGSTKSPTVTVTFSNDTPVQGSLNNPRVTVVVTRTDLPTFFARIWGTTRVTVSASATAEAYNPSGLATNGSSPVPVASTCVKPWLLPNMDPSPTATGNDYIFDPASGAIQDSSLLGWESPSPATNGTRLHTVCPGGCGTPPTPLVWQYYPADFSNFTLPNSSSVSCSGVGPGGLSQQQLNVAGCVQTPIACNQTIGIDSSSYSSLDSDTANAVDCLTHSTTGGGDKIDEITNPNFPFEPFEFLAGADNPIVAAATPGLSAGTDVLVSDSLVTVPVFDSRTLSSSVQVIGFVQLFLQPTGTRVARGGSYPNQVRTTVINMVGCGTNLANSTAVPVYGNGPSAVPVRLISPPAPAN